MTTPLAPPLPQPADASKKPRIASLDVIRGLAILGTLASNIWLFQAFFGERVIDVRWAELLSWTSEGKFLGLLTIMFGIGLEIQRQAAARRGLRWPGTYLVRAGLLFLDGVLNYIFVVQFDVLRVYAVLGFVVAFVLLMPEKRQWIFIGVALTTHVTLILLPWALPGFYGAPGFVFPGEFLVAEGRPPYAYEIHNNALTVLSDLTVGSDTGSIFTLGLVCFTLGALVYRHGILEARGSRLRRWVMVVGFGVGIPLDLAFFLSQETYGFGRFLAAPFTAFGILALMAAFYQRHPIGVAGRHLSLVGRMALSCYVLQNILGRVAQRWLGGSSLSPMLDPLIGTVLMFLVIGALVILFAKVWLRYYSRGPLEYVWDLSFRFLTRRRSR
ncbi:predicted membrane protein [Sanguibacter keddieii DSM 10542]|uniref:Predicted membrane protein n=1 Tax=Sanguibacter keddieii (strain ATCC 51767 / DSM 10542 / NCFB 3025 / ST-74) TaxID=446469 RepID=D1BF95_SANKS|nr:DUF418 domain-containing protein [Sanguibacter keddieii]ACZ21391.1 predicted membrane protein [Sanguibacter keddieii DSM 10542]